MTTTVKIHVNGRYRATVQQDDLQPVIVEGNYVGSPNPSGERAFYLAHPATSTFVVTEEYMPEVPAAVEEAPAAAEVSAAEAKPAPEADQTA